MNSNALYVSHFVDEEYSLPSSFLSDNKDDDDEEEDSITTIITFNKICSRYWKLSILEIPFASQSIQHFVLHSTDYSCGHSELDPPTIPVSDRVTVEGPRIKLLDLFGIPLFPLIPPPARTLGMCEQSDVIQFAVW